MTTPNMMPCGATSVLALPRTRATARAGRTGHALHERAVAAVPGRRALLHGFGAQLSRQIEDPELKKQVLGFIGQEAMHTREHIEYNDKLDKRLWTMPLPFDAARDHDRARAHGDPREPAAVGPRAPHRQLGRSYQQMWMWHAMEKPSTRRCRTTCGAP